MLTNSIISALQNHKSIRRFQEKAIPEEVINTILHTGTRAANGGNLQNYSFIVVDNHETKEVLNKYDNYHDLTKIPLVIIALIDTYRIKRWFDINNAENPHVNEASGFYISNWDALIALHNICIAAESLGLGAFYNGNILEYDIYEALGAPKYTFPAGMLCVGYPEKIPKNSSKRLPLDAIVHRNSYKRFSDEKIKHFYSERERVWSLVPEKRKKNLEKNGIHNLPQAIAKQKFNKELTTSKSEKIGEILSKSSFNLKKYLKE